MGMLGVTVGIAGTVKPALWAELYGIRNLGAIQSVMTALMVVSTAGSPLLVGFARNAGRPPSPDKPPHSVPPPDRSDEPGPTGPTPRSRSSRKLWAQLPARSYEVLPLLCPACGGEMRIISFITLPSTMQDILLHLDLPHRPPRVSPARGPPQAELHFDQTPAFDLAAPEVIPEYEFDQSPPHDWEA